MRYVTIMDKLPNEILLVVLDTCTERYQFVKPSISPDFSYYLRFGEWW